MAFYKLFDKNTGIYKSSDSIENFQFRITLKTINTLIKIPKFNVSSISSENNMNSDNEIIDNTNNNDNDKFNVKDEIEMVTLKWQEKQFNLNEIKYYGNKDNCKTDMEKKYYQMLSNAVQISPQNHSEGNNDDIIENKLKKKIFTYTTDDNYKFRENENNEKLKEIENILEKNIKLYGNSIDSSNNEDNVISNQHDDVDDDNELLIKNDKCSMEKLLRKRYQNLNNFETMLIMAQLEIETILFIIKWRSSDGLLIIYPDFNNININPYFLEINLDCRHMYQYSIENLSLTLVSDDNNTKLMDNLLIRSREINSLTMSDLKLFHIPPRRCTFIYLFIEIISAANFEYDNIHVLYNIHLPNRCEIINNGQLNGSTQSSLKLQTQTDHFYNNYYDEGDKNINFWKFGHCFELNILCDEDYEFNDNLKITFEIISVDGWERERTEGYTHTIIPFVSGSIQEKLNCYRDSSHNTTSRLIDKLERYFIGGRRQLNIDEFNGIPSNANNKPPTKLNRYGSETLSTGILLIKRQIILQKNPNFVQLLTKKINTAAPSVTTSSSITSVRNTGKKYNLTIDDVVAAYHLAKQRLHSTITNEEKHNNNNNNNNRNIDN